MNDIQYVAGKGFRRKQTPSMSKDNGNNNEHKTMTDTHKSQDIWVESGNTADFRKADNFSIIRKFNVLLHYYPKEGE